MTDGASRRFVDNEDQLSASNLNSLDIGGNVYVSPNGGLNVRVTAMRLRNISVPENDIDYAGAATDQAVTDSTTNYVYLLISGGTPTLTINTSGFPNYVSQQDFVPLATVVTSGGAVTSVNDKRITGYF